MITIDNLLLEHEINEIGAKLMAAMEKVSSILQEALADHPSQVTNLGSATGDLEAEFDEAAKRFAAAKAAFGIVNKLPAGPQRTEHRKRITGNMNRLKALVDRITKQADQQAFEAEHELARQGNQSRLGQNNGPPTAAPPHQALPVMR